MPFFYKITKKMVFLCQCLLYVFPFWNIFAAAVPPKHANRMNMKAFYEGKFDIISSSKDGHDIATGSKIWELDKERSLADPIATNKNAESARKYFHEDHKKIVDFFEEEPVQTYIPAYEALSKVDPSPAQNANNENTVYPLPFCVYSDYSLVKELGRGADGIVSLYQRKRDGKRFAKKEALQNYKSQQFLLNEIGFLNQLKGKGVTADIECIGKDGESFMMEYLSGVNLDQLNVTELPGIDPEAKVMYLAEKVVDIYITLHQLNIIHSDGHMENWLLDPKTGSLFLIDFGRASYAAYPSHKNKDIQSAGKLLATIYYNYVSNINDHQTRTWIHFNGDKVIPSLPNYLKKIISEMWPKALVDFNQLKTLISQMHSKSSNLF